MTLYKLIKWYYGFKLRKCIIPQLTYEQRKKLTGDDLIRYDRMMGTVKRYLHLNDILMQEVREQKQYIEALTDEKFRLSLKVKELEKKLSS